MKRFCVGLLAIVVGCATKIQTVRFEPTPQGLAAAIDANPQISRERNGQIESGVALSLKGYVGTATYWAPRIVESRFCGYRVFSEQTEECIELSDIESFLGKRPKNLKDDLLAPVQALPALLMPVDG